MANEVWGERSFGHLGNAGKTRAVDYAGDAEAFAVLRSAILYDSSLNEKGVPTNPISVTGGVSVTGGLNGLIVVPQIEVSGSWTTLISAIRIDDNPTSYNSSALGVQGCSLVAVETFIDSTLSPTTIQLIPQFSVDGGSTWANFGEGFWASMFWEDTATASGLREVWHLPVAGFDLVRFRIVGTGTDATNYFDFTLRARALRGAYSGAHA